MCLSQSREQILIPQLFNCMTTTLLIESESYLNHSPEEGSCFKLENVELNTNMAKYKMTKTAVLQFVLCFGCLTSDLTHILSLYFPYFITISYHYVAEISSKLHKNELQGVENK